MTLLRRSMCLLIDFEFLLFQFTGKESFTEAEGSYVNESGV